MDAAPTGPSEAADRLFSAADLDAARQAGVIDAEAYYRLNGFLAGRPLAAPPLPQAAGSPDEKPRFDVTHVLWYAGALIVMSAMGIFSTTAFAALGGGALTVTAVLYAGAFLFAGNYLWSKGLRTPGGLAIAVAVSMVPLAIYGIQDAFDLWRLADDPPGKYRNFFTYIHGSWVYMEAATLAAAWLALRRWPFPFIAFVAAIALWFMSMDIAAWFFRHGSSDFDIRRHVSLAFGCVMIVLAWAIDLRRRRTSGDIAFWLHVFGVMCFWGGLSAGGSDSALVKALYCAINIGLVFLGVFLGRRVYAVFGTLGIMFYLGDLAWHVFDNVLGFSFALSAIGVGVIWLGLVLHRNEARLAAWMHTHLPPALGALRPTGA